MYAALGVCVCMLRLCQPMEHVSLASTILVQVVEMTLKENADTGTCIDPTVYTGLLGTAFTCLRSYKVTGNQQDLQLCAEIVDTCAASARSSPR